MSTFGRDDDERWRKERAAPSLKVVSSQDDIGWRGHIKHADRLHDMRFPAPAEVVPGFVPEGLSILAGRPKVGKSWMALEMALGVSMAEKVLGDTIPESGDVLYAALEDTFPRLQRRIKKLLWPPRPTWPDRLALATQWRRLDEGGVEDIQDWAQSVDAPKLCILDTLEWKKAALKTYCRKPLERRKPWQAPTVSTFASLCYSTASSLTQSETQPANSTRSHPPTSAKQFAKGSRLTE